MCVTVPAWRSVQSSRTSQPHNSQAPYSRGYASSAVQPTVEGRVLVWERRSEERQRESKPQTIERRAWRPVEPACEGDRGRDQEHREVVLLREPEHEQAGRDGGPDGGVGTA